MGTIDISYLSLGIGLLLLSIPLFYIWKFKTGLLRATLIGTARMIVQLFFIGIYLKYLFLWNNPWINFLWVIVMILVASQTALARTQLKRKILLIPISVGFLCSVVCVGMYFIGIVLRLENVFSAQYFIPIFGILMGNMLSSNVIALNTYYSGLKREQQLYRYLLGNGATRTEAQAPFIRQAIIKAFSPLIANISVMGLVAFPGTMIGQILGGSSPNVAIKYQMMIMVITLQIGLTDAEATGALLCLDVTEAVLDEAIALGYNLVISHHPLIFKGYKSITGKDYVERCILKAIKNDIVIYSAHTNLDNAPEGVNFKIAEKIGLKNVRVLEAKENALLKLVTFVPVTRAEEVRTALASAGCGCIGNYDSCSYNVEGEGMFRALESANPYCGKIGELHVEKETRIETILPTYRKAEVIKALLAAHPYEEPAFDLYPLQNSWQQAGAGVIGELETPETELEFLKRIKKTFEVGCLKHNRLTGREIQTVALCGGAGAFLMPLAIRNRADVFITGEIKYHDYFGHDTDILLAEIGHYESEQYTKEIFYTIIRDLFPNVEVQQSKINTNPIKYM